MTTYTVPCICIIITNTFLVYKLYVIKRKREALFKLSVTQRLKQFPSIHSESTQPAAANSTDERSDNELPATAAAAVDDDKLGNAVHALLEHKRNFSVESRCELGKIAVLLILSCFYICFTFPVSVTLSIRASLTSAEPRCRHVYFAHLTRLLTSVKDVNYALNGYIYVFFFRFYRQRFVQLFTCGSRYRPNCQLPRSIACLARRCPRPGPVPKVTVTSADRAECTIGQSGSDSLERARLDGPAGHIV